MGVLGKEQNCKEAEGGEFLLLKTDMLMELCFWSKLIGNNYLTIFKRNGQCVLCKFVRDFILIINRGPAVNRRLRNGIKGRGRKMGVFVGGGGFKRCL